MNSSTATGREGLPEGDVEQVSPEMFQKIYDLGRSACGRCQDKEPKFSLALPLTLGWLVLAAYATWLGADSYFKGIQADQKDTLWREIFQPALLGETTRGLRVDTTFDSKARKDILRQCIPPASPSHPPEEWLAIARAWIILDDRRQSEAAYQEAISTFTNPHIILVTQAELLSLNGNIQGSAEKLLAVMKKMNISPMILVPMPTLDAGAPPQPQVDAGNLLRAIPVQFSEAAAPATTAPIPIIEVTDEDRLAWDVAASAMNRLISLGANVQLPCGFPRLTGVPCAEPALPTNGAMPAEAPVPPSNGIVPAEAPAPPMR